MPFYTVLSGMCGLGGPEWALLTRFTVGFPLNPAKLLPFLTVLAGFGLTLGLYPGLFSPLRMVVSCLSARFCLFSAPFLPDPVLNQGVSLPSRSEVYPINIPALGSRMPLDHPFHCWAEPWEQAA